MPANSQAQIWPKRVFRFKRVSSATKFAYFRELSSAVVARTSLGRKSTGVYTPASKALEKKSAGNWNFFGNSLNFAEFRTKLLDWLIGARFILVESGFITSSANGAALI